jgi:hypothetical protein
VTRAEWSAEVERIFGPVIDAPGDINRIGQPGDSAKTRAFYDAWAEFGRVVSQECSRESERAQDAMREMRDGAMIVSGLYTPFAGIALVRKGAP